MPGKVREIPAHTNIDIASSKKESSRLAFNQMVNECKAGLADIVVVKKVSRFGRDTLLKLKMIHIVQILTMDSLRVQRMAR